MVNLNIHLPKRNAKQCNCCSTYWLKANRSSAGVIDMSKSTEAGLWSWHCLKPRHSTIGHQALGKAVRSDYVMNIQPRGMFTLQTGRCCKMHHLERRSTNTTLAVLPCLVLGRSTMKSMLTLSQLREGICNGWSKPATFRLETLFL